MRSRRLVVLGVLLVPLQVWAAAQCVTGGNGLAACGYDCKVGGDGVARCADTANGACIVQGNGQVTCTGFRPSPWQSQAPKAECRVGGNGLAACGYACKVGGDGVARCADTANGACIVQGNGQVTCTAFAPWQSQAPKAECRVGGNGLAACGYACKVGGDGVARCADTANGACIVQGNGQVVCTALSPW